MRLALAAVLLFACSKNPETQIDAAVHVVDARAIDAHPDAPPDAPPDAQLATSQEVTDACMHACAAIGTCLGQAPEADCQSGCETDLADCTSDQVATLDACTTEDCGDIQNEDSPLLACILGVSCVQGAAMKPPRK